MIMEYQPTVNEELPVKTDASTFNLSLPASGADHLTVSVLVNVLYFIMEFILLYIPQQLNFGTL